MATNVGTAYVTIMPSMNGFASKLNSGISSAFSGASSTSNKAGSASGSNFSTGFAAKLGGVAGLASSAFTAVGNVVSSSMSSAISRVDTLNQFPKVMQSLGFSASDASATMSKLSDGIEGLPTSLDAITASTQKIALLTGDLDLASDTALALNNAFLASGSGSEDAARGLTQYVQMLSKGKVDSQSWNTILETMGSSLKTVAARLGYTSTTVGGDLYSALQDGTLSFDDFNKAIIECNQAQDGFASTAASASAGIGTSMTNFRTAIVKNLANIINAINGAGAISGFFDGLKSAVNKAGSAIVPVAEKIGQAIPKIGEALSKLSLSGVQGFFTGLLANLQRATSPAQALRIAITQLTTGFKGLTGVDLSKVRMQFMLLAGNILNSNPALLALAQFVATNISNFKQFASALANAHTPVEVLKASIDYLKDSFSNMGAFAASLQNQLQTVFNALPAPIQNVIAKVDEIKNKIVEFATSTVGQGAIITGIATAIAAVFGGRISAAITLAKTALTGLQNPLGTIKAAVSLLGTALTSLISGGGIGGFVSLARMAGTALVGMVSPVGLVVAGIVALAAAFAYTMATNSSFATSIMTTVASIGSSLMPIISTVGTAIQQIATTVLPVLMSMIQQLAPVLAQIVSVVLQIAAAAAPLITQLVSMLVPVITQIVTTVTQLAAAVLPIVITVLTTIMGVITALLPVISNVISVVLSVVSVVISAVTGILGVVTPIITTIISFISMVVAAIGTIITIVSSVFSSVASVVTGAISTVVSVVSSGISGVINFFSNMVSSVGSGVSSLFSTVSSVFNNIASTVINLANSARNGAETAFNSLKSAVTNTISNVFSTISSLPSQIMGVFSGAASWLYNSGASIIQGLVDGIQGAIEGAISAVSSAVSSIRDLFPFSPAKEGPFSGHGYTTWSGKALITDWGNSIKSNAGTAVLAAKNAAAQVSDALVADSASNISIGTRADLVRERGTSGTSIVINVNDATLNDDAAMQQAALNFMNELVRMNRLNRAGA